MKENQIYKNGIPYGPDLKRLDDAFPTPDEDQIIRYEQIETILGVSKTDQRFRGVLSSWRRSLWRSRNIDTVAVSGIGIKILAPDERSTVREKDLTMKAKQVTRARHKYASIPRERLNTEGQQRYDHVMLLSGRMQAAIDDVKKSLPADIAPVKSLPKPKLVKTA